MTEQQLYDEAFQQMGAAPLEPNEPTPARRKAWRVGRKNYDDKLARAAQLAGFESIGKLADALNNHTHKVVKIEEEEHENTSDSR